MEGLINLLENFIINNDNNKIDNIDNDNYFTFNNLSTELDNIEYSNIRNKALIDNFMYWIKSNKYHTFAKKQKGWLNTFRTQSNLLKTEVKYRPEIIINYIIYRNPPKYLENLCKRVGKIIKTYKFEKNKIFKFQIKNLLKKITIWSSLIIETEPIELLNILINANILIKRDYNIVIDRFTIYSLTNKRKLATLPFSTST